MPLRTLLRASSPLYRTPISRAGIATLPSCPHIYIHPGSASLQNTQILSLLPTTPPNSDLAIGTTTAIPPTPASVKENGRFMDILQDVLRKHASQDPDVISQAQAMASSGGSNLGSGAALFPSQQRRRSRERAAFNANANLNSNSSNTATNTNTSATQNSRQGDGAGGASSQGGTGSGGHSGYIHVYDYRHPPDYGRIPDPEDIFGSLEVDGRGEFVDGGRWQGSGTYRLCTRDGILGLSPFLRERMIERLREEESKKAR